MRFSHLAGARLARRLAASLLAFAGVSAAVAQSTYENYGFSAFAGSVRVGFNDGPVASSTFFVPGDVVADSAGNLFVTDTFNSTIRKISGGVVSTFAGSAGQSGVANGTGNSARFYAPFGIAIDSADNLYVTDYYASTVRKITPAGVVTTLAGAGLFSGNTDGTGAAARFTTPYGIDIDSAGNLYVTDVDSHVIRKITPAGVVTTIAGSAGSSGNVDGTGGAARFQQPSGIAVDSNGNLFVSTAAHTIRMITPAGVVTTFAGSAAIPGITNGTGPTARFNEPDGLAIDGFDQIYVADYRNQTIRRITPAGVVTTFAGTMDEAGSNDGAPGIGRMFNPIGLDFAAGNILVAEFNNAAVRQAPTTGISAGTLETRAGWAGAFAGADGSGTSARFSRPTGAAVDSAGNVYIADTWNHTIRKITPAGAVTTLAGSAGQPGSADGTGSSARFRAPAGIAVDTAGNVYVADEENHTIRKITPAGVVTTLAGSAGSASSNDGTGANARFNFPEGVAVDANGNVFVADTTNQTIRRITPAGVVTTFAGIAGQQGSSNAATGTFLFPTGLAIDNQGALYVADENHLIRKIVSQGNVTTLAGSAGNSGSADGTGTSARFNIPVGLAVDSARNVYVSDTANFTIRKITAAGVVTTLGGTPLASGTASGSGAAARFSFPMGIAVDNVGNLYVVDAGNDRIRLGAAVLSPSFTLQPESHTITSGTAVVFKAAASGSPTPTYQWMRNGSPISGATNSTLLLTGVGDSDAGNYTVVATNSLGNATSNAATLTIASPGTTPGYLRALSLRGNVGADADAFFIGFSLEGAGGNVLIKAIGPGIAAAPFSVPGAMTDPKLDLTTAITNLALESNDNWGGTAPLISAISATSSFPYGNPNSLDAAMVRFLPGGGANFGTYIATASGVNKVTGVTLVEFYGLDAPSNLKALSLRGNIGAGANAFFVGLIISGNTSKTILVKNVGPGLAVAPFNVGGAMADPEIELLRSANPSNISLATNNDWGGTPSLVTANSLANAFPLNDGGSRDAALIMTLAPDVYIVKASGVNETTGVGLIEIYGL